MKVIIVNFSTSNPLITAFVYIYMWTLRVGKMHSQSDHMSVERKWCLSRVDK